MKKFKKSTNAEIEKRIFEVERLIIEGNSYSQIIRYASENWGITSRQTDEYISRVKDVLKKQFEENKDKYKEMLVNQYMEIYKKAIESKNFSAGVQALNGLSKIMGLQIDKVEATVKQTYSEWIESQDGDKK